MIACAVIVSDVHEPLTLWSVEKNEHTVTHCYSCLFILVDTVVQLCELLEAVTECLVPYCNLNRGVGIV